jgi:hypothetical protein
MQKVVTSLTFWNATTSFQMHHSQGTTFPIALSKRWKSLSCVSALCIGLVPPVPHWRRSFFFLIPTKKKKYFFSQKKNKQKQTFVNVVGSICECCWLLFSNDFHHSESLLVFFIAQSLNYSRKGKKKRNLPYHNRNPMQTRHQDGDRQTIFLVKPKLIQKADRCSQMASSVARGLNWHDMFIGKNKTTSYCILNFCHFIAEGTRL